MNITTIIFIAIALVVSICTGVYFYKKNLEEIAYVIIAGWCMALLCVGLYFAITTDFLNPVNWH